MGSMTVLSTYPKKVWAGAMGLAITMPAMLTSTSAIAAVVSGEVLCYENRPCIEAVTSDTKTIQVLWRGRDYYDFFNVSWYRQGIEEQNHYHIREGGNRGSVALTRILPNTQYVIKVQGCNTQLFGGPTCTEWETQEITTQNFEVPQEPSATQPVEGQPVDAPANAAPANAPTTEAPAAEPTAPSGSSVVVPTTEVTPGEAPAAPAK